MTLVFVAVLALILITYLLSLSRFQRWRKNLILSLEAPTSVAQTASGAMEYRLYGETGPVMLIVHGSPGGYDQFDFEPESLPFPMRGLAISRPGYLRTPISVGATPDQQADAYAALLDTLGLESVVVMGASGGGPSSIAFAARHPQRTQALILYAPVSESFKMMKLGPMAYDYSAWILSGLLTSKPERLVRLLVTGTNNQARILDSSAATQKVVGAARSTLPPSIRNAGFSNDAIVFEALDLPADDVAAPTLIMHGTADRNVPFGQSQALAGRIPSASLLQVEGGDHFMRWTHKTKISEAVSAFLKEHLS